MPATLPSAPQPIPPASPAIPLAGITAGQYGGANLGTQNGATPVSTGYGNAIQNLGTAANLAGNTISGQENALGTQLQQNESNIQQQLTNNGLANSTILPTEQQAPIQTYNQGLLNTQNQGALLQMNALQALANMQASGGQALQNPGAGLPKNTVQVPGTNTPYPFSGGSGGGAAPNGAPPNSPATFYAGPNAYGQQDAAAEALAAGAVGGISQPATPGYMGQLSAFMGNIGSILNNTTGQTTDYGAGGQALTPDSSSSNYDSGGDGYDTDNLSSYS